MRSITGGPDRLQDLADVNPAGLVDGDLPVWNAATSRFLMQPSSGGGVSLSAITAGTLQVPLNLLGTMTPDNTLRQLIGDTTGVLLNTPAATDTRLQIAGGDGLKLSTSTNNTTGGTGLLNPNTSLASYTYITAANVPASTSGANIYLTGRQYTTSALGTAHQNKFLMSVPSLSVSGSIPGEFQWWMDTFDPATGTRVAKMVTGGILSLFKSNTIEATISPANLTASRAYTLPDAAGTLMVSGGSGSVSLSNLTAGTLGVTLALGTGIGITGGTAAGALSILLNTSDAADSGLIEMSGGGAADYSRGAYVQLRGNEHATRPACADVMLGNIAGAGFRIFTDNGTNAIFKAAATAITIGNGSQNVDINFSGQGAVNLASGGTVTAGNRQLIGTAGGASWNLPTSGVGLLSVNGTTEYSWDATSFILASGNTLLGGGAAANWVIGCNTTDGDDSGSVVIVGGSANSNTRGAKIQICGNEKATLAGNIQLVTGEGSGASINLIDANTLTKFSINDTGIGFFAVTPIARPTTAFAAAAFVAGAGTAVNDASTFGGYTIKQVVQALQSLGLLT